MFENRSGFSYNLRENSPNNDTFTWKKNDANSSKNNYNLTELKIDLNDTLLFGTKDSWVKLDEAINRY